MEFGVQILSILLVNVKDGNKNMNEEWLKDMWCNDSDVWIQDGWGNDMSFWANEGWGNIAWENANTRTKEETEEDSWYDSWSDSLFCRLIEKLEERVKPVERNEIDIKVGYVFLSIVSVIMLSILAFIFYGYIEFWKRDVNDKWIIYIIIAACANIWGVLGIFIKPWRRSIWHKVVSFILILIISAILSLAYSNKLF